MGRAEVLLCIGLDDDKIIAADTMMLTSASFRGPGIRRLGTVGNLHASTR